MTDIRLCTCKHEFQDRQYGPSQRVHNECKIKSGGIGWRCTVCSKVKESAKKVEK